MARGLQVAVNATCAHPESLKGTSVFQAPSSSFVCGELCLGCVNGRGGGQVFFVALQLNSEDMLIAHYACFF